MSKRSMSSLLQNKSFINGAWVSAASGRVFNVMNPATGTVVGEVPDCDKNDTEKAIDAAYTAFKTWENTTAKERARLLHKWFTLLEENKDEIAKLTTAESGKPLVEALGEVNYGNGFIEWYAEEARRIHGNVISSPVPHKEMLLIKRPIGVAALITPWNFPVAMITRKAGAALAAGCTCVIKPAEDTPLSALTLAYLAQQAGIPDGVINVVTASRAHATQVGETLCSSPKVSGLSFTGSTTTGKLLYSMCAPTVKRLSLELGGNAPFIVFKSADIDKAVQGAIACKFRNCGQTCVSANRLFIQEEIFDLFVKELGYAMKRQLVLGDGLMPNVTQGPLINETQAKKVASLVNDAVDKGAVVHLGGKPATAYGKLFYEPTLLTNVNDTMDVYHQEIFGPVAVCIKFKSEDEVIEIANATRSGLAAYFYSSLFPQIWRVARLLESGMVGINEGIISTPEAAFGGIKESGIGREGSHYGIDEYTYVKYLCFSNM